MNTSMLTQQQAAVVERFVAHESARRHHLVVYLSGAHAYGFPSPDSDVDLKAVHIEPTARLVGLRAHVPAFDRLEVIDGVEIDYTSNELGGVLASVLRGNGNYIERVLGKLRIVSAPELDALVPLVRKNLARNVFGHYAGFAGSQRRAVDASDTPSAKKILYVLRTALTGTHLLGTGELVVDVTLLLDEYGFGDARRLIEIKQAGERTALAADEVTHWRRELDRVMALLERARDTSCLPDAPPHPDELETWLIETRRAFWS